MPVVFTDPDLADEDGILAIGGEMSVSTLTTAYLSGIFPWPINEEYPLVWFSLNPRGVIYTDQFYCSRSFKKFLRKHPYQVKFNTNFEAVIRACAHTKRVNQTDTWINEEIITSYLNLFYEKKAYSVEVYEEDLLVGGMYGTCFGQLYSGESMFHIRPNTSKLALYSICRTLQKSSVKLLDTQMLTPIVSSLGGQEIPRHDFLQYIQQVNTKTSRDSIFSDNSVST